MLKQKLKDTILMPENMFWNMMMFWISKELLFMREEKKFYLEIWVLWKKNFQKLHMMKIHKK